MFHPKKYLKLTQDKLKDVTTRGATNIWNGLAEGLRVCRQGQGDGSQKRLAHLILLTDGQTAERNEVLPRMMNAKGAEERLPCTVSTFGFGYNIDSNLLVDMAHGGFGVYSFIPDAGFVGTIFVNYISNILSTMSLSAMLVVDPEGGEIQEVYGGLKVEDAGNGCKRLDLPTVQYGQPKDIVLRMSVADGEDAYISAKATYKLADGEERETPLQEGLVTDEPSISEVSLQLWRSRFADLLEQAISHHDALKLLSDLSSTIQQKSLDDGYDQDPFIHDLLQDLQGEAIDAVELAAFQKWGRHYLPSLMFAHRRQMCNNFKDPGVQHYGGEMFQALRDEADEKFNQLPPPEPTRSNVRGYTYSAAPALRPGRRVKIRGLVQQAELNGQFGRLLRLDSSVDPPRWLLRMKGHKEVIYRLLPERLRLAPLPKRPRLEEPEADDAEPEPDADPMEGITEENVMAD
eukprot:s1511_g5.t1